MDYKYVISPVLHIHLPYVREYSKNNLEPETTEENWFFEYLTETILPLLEVYDRLDEDNIPFKTGVAISPILGQMLNDDHMHKKFTTNLDQQIEFGKQELIRLKDNSNLYSLAKYYFGATYPPYHFYLYIGLAALK